MWIVLLLISCEWHWHLPLFLNCRYKTFIFWLLWRERPLLVNSINFECILTPLILNELYLKVRVNDPKTKKPLFSSGLIGDNNAIARHGIHGLYWLYTVDIPGGWLVEGDNTVFLTQPRSVSPFQGIMYDYIRLEGPPGT